MTRIGIYRYHKCRAEKKAAKRPPTPFASFVKSSYAGLVAQNPGVPASALMPKIAEAWKAVSSEEKAGMATEYKTQVGLGSFHFAIAYTCTCRTRSPCRNVHSG